MLKKTISIFFAVFLCAACCFVPVGTLAYEPSDLEINAKNGLLVSLDTGEYIYEKGDINSKVYPASIAKIMTAVLMLESESYNPEARIKMNKETLDLISGTGSAVSLLKEGEEISELDLVYMVLMASFGDCAYLAAAHYAGSVEAFVDKMNEKAQELGLTGTHYSNPVGLHDEGTYTTVEDIYKLTVYALKNETFKTVSSSQRYVVPATNFSEKRTISSTNFLMNTATNYYYQYASGVKTGYTDEAGRCLVSTASYNGYNYLCILMGCTPNANRRYEFYDSANLYRWAFNNFSFREIANSDNPVSEMPVELSFETDYVPLYIEKGFISVMPNDADDSTITIDPHLSSESVDAPVKKGDVLGYADIIYAEKVIGRVDLVAGADIKSNPLLVAFRAVKNLFSSWFMKIIFILIALLVLIFIIMCIRLNVGRKAKRRVKYKAYKERNSKYDHEN